MIQAAQTKGYFDDRLLNQQTADWSGCSQGANQVEESDGGRSARYAPTLSIREDLDIYILRLLEDWLISFGAGLGKLTKDLSHLSICFAQPKKNVINIELHHGVRKNVAALRTVRTIVNNMIIGVTKGFKYKMRYVYAHFPINVNLEKNSDTGLYEVEIRYACDSEVGSMRRFEIGHDWCSCSVHLGPSALMER